MHCKNCEYVLWNLTTRQCPECGAPFAPSQFEFVPNSVRFCCPHCRQAYYGTSARGHLVPEAFACVGCGRTISMDEMVLLPAEGVQDHQTRPGMNPWVERRRVGWFKGWFSTIWAALLGPIRLIRGTEVSSSLGHAWWFCVVTVFATFAVGLIPTLCMFSVMPWLAAQGGSGPPGVTPGAMAGVMSGVMAAGYLFGLAFTLLYVLVWALVTHGLLRITGPGPGPFRRTLQAILYSAGTCVVSVIPCVGNGAVIWWCVSATLMVKEGHRVHAGRAAFAVLALPVTLLALLVGLYVAIIVMAVAGVRATGTQVTVVPETQTVLDSVLEHAAANQGRGPRHALDLVAGGLLTEWDLVAFSTMTDPENIPVADVNLLDWSFMPADDQQAVVDDAVAALPAGLVAHRVGDFVFTYHGIDLSAADGGLWVVIMWPDPDSGGTSGQPVAVGYADGTVASIPVAGFAGLLAAQNRLRARYGLPPLPPPWMVTHAKPAGTGPDAGREPGP